MSGLKDDIQLPVRMFNPRTIAHAVTLARLQENTLMATQKRWHTSRNALILPTPRASFNPTPMAALEAPPKPTSVMAGRPTRTLSVKEIKERRENNLCCFNLR